MSKRYKLLKDLPNVKAGAILEWNSTQTWQGGPYIGGRYITDSMPSETSCPLVFTTEDVENNFDWFEELKPERIEVEVNGVSWVKDQPEKLLIGLTNNQTFPEDKFPAIKAAIESVLNEGSLQFEPIRDEYDAPPLYPERYVKHLLSKIESLEIIHKAFEHIKDNKFTQEQYNKGIEDAFRAARKECQGDHNFVSAFYALYPSFGSYLKSLQP